MTRKVIVGFSGGVTSAECAVIALEEFPREEIVLLWHDTKKEDADTLRFLMTSRLLSGRQSTASLATNSCSSVTGQQFGYILIESAEPRSQIHSHPWW
jgi:NH3-dependent NAD+ synthetase